MLLESPRRRRWLSGEDKPALAGYAAAMGAFLEFVYNDLIGPNHSNSIQNYSAAIRAVGIEHCILSSDLGQAGNPHPAAGLLAFYQALREQGFSESEIDRMGKINPAKVLGLQ